MGILSLHQACSIKKLPETNTLANFAMPKKKISMTLNTGRPSLSPEENVSSSLSSLVYIGERGVIMLAMMTLDNNTLVLALATFGGMT